MNGKIEQVMIIKQLGLEGIETKGDTFNFRCPVCGDSKKDTSKKRGYFYLNKNKNRGYKFKCHNCGLNMSLARYLELYEPALYKKYLFDELKHKKDDRTFKTQFDVVEKIDNKEIKRFLSDKIDDNIIIPAKKLQNINVMTYIYDRKIPKNKVKLIFYVDNFYNDLYIPMKELIKEIKHENHDENHFKTDPRIFWFIKNRNNDIIGIQGRSLNPKAKLRYLTIKLVDEPMIGNIENINLNEPVLVTEGFIDSLFLPNCVSLNGSSFSSTVTKMEELKPKSLNFIFDNEPYNKEIKKKVDLAILESIQNTTINIGVCLLPKYLREKGKDINDYIKAGISEIKLLNIINENTFYGLIAKIKSSRW